MGLKEKQKLKELQDTVIPDRTRELLSITDAPIAFDIDWPGFQDSFEALNFLDNVAIHRLNMALRVIASQPLGKDALKDGLRTVRIVNVRDKAAKKLEFAKGVLAMTGAYAEGLSGAFSDGEIREILSSGL